MSDRLVGAMETKPQRYEHLRAKAREARHQAEQLREMYKIATCGLTMEYQHRHDHERENWINYGTYQVPRHIALRVADSYVTWAAEYDSEAERIEEMLAAMLRGEHV